MSRSYTATERFVSRKILLIVEGDDTEVILLRAFFRSLCGEDVPIYSYGTNSMSLYHELSAYCKDYGQDTVDTMEFLRNRPNLSNQDKATLSQTYTDIYLAFDFDYQTPLVHESKYEAYQFLLSFFDDETDHGRLFFSYPMIESYADHNPLGLPRKMNRSVKPGLGDAYKTLVNQRGYQGSPNDYSSLFWAKLVVLHLLEAERLLAIKNHPLRYDSFLQRVNQKAIQKRVFKMIKTTNPLIPILNTALFIPISYYGERLYDPLVNDEVLPKVDF
jgi:hypothetical protein